MIQQIHQPVIEQQLKSEQYSTAKLHATNTPNYSTISKRSSKPEIKIIEKLGSDITS